MTFLGCSVCGAETCVCNDPIVVDVDTRARAHAALDAWLDRCAEHAEKLYEQGSSGYVGRFVVRASADDVELHLSLEQSLLESV
jgi:hypothetical protein